jgi:uncharacterized lipoprotein YmbA
MTWKFRIHLVAAACLPALLLLSGCATTSRPVEFYTLSPVTAPGGAPEGPAAGCRDVVIGVGAVGWPSYLDRPQIVTRLSPNRIRFDEFHRWGGPPDADFQRVLIDNLSKLLHNDYVIKYPGKFLRTPRYRVQVLIDQFDGRPGDAVILNAAWSVLDSRSDREGRLHEAVIREPARGQGYEGMVAAASAAVAELSRQIASELSSRCGLAQEK